MIPRDIYEIIHIIGIAMLFAAIGGVAIHAANGGSKANTSTRGFMAALFGTGSFLILLGGFGMMARLGIVRGMPPGWILVKMVIWLVLSAIVLVPYRKPALAKPFAILLPLLAGLAVYMAVYKPI
ncbi:MAG: hypothetical protein WCK74_05180 [Gemmatimonadaceae bacterium]|jgi:hypothetical protein